MVKKQQKKVRLIFFEVEVQDKSFGLCFWRLHDKKKGTTNASNTYNFTSKLCLVYWEVKLQQDRCGWCIYKLKCHKTGEITHLEATKQQSRYCWCFSILNCWKKSTTDVSRRRKQTHKVRRMYLPLKNLKISGK